MSAFKNPIALVALVGAAVIPLAAGAAEAQAAADQDASAIADSQIVARDPVTGQLRAATAEEAQALRRARAEQRRGGGSVTSATHSHSSGAHGARLTEEFMNYSVVVRTADGKLVELCVGDLATMNAKPAQAKKSELPTE